MASTDPQLGQERRPVWLADWGPRPNEPAAWYQRGCSRICAMPDLVQIAFPWAASQDPDPVPPIRVARRYAKRRSTRRNSEGDAMPYTVAEAAKAIGKSKAAVFRAIRKGTISVARDEFERCFPDRPGRASPRIPSRARRVGRRASRHGHRRVAIRRVTGAPRRCARDNRGSSAPS